MRVGRRGRRVALLYAGLAAVVAYLGVGAVVPANSARTAESAHAVDRTATYRIAFFGDSLSVGSGASDWQHGYIALVSRWLRTRGKRVSATVYAKGGVPVAHWQYVHIPRGLDAAVVELGTNDVRLATPPARFAQEYWTLISRIRARNARVQLLCLSVWPSRRGANLDRIINGKIRAICPGGYVDFTRFRDRSHIRSADGFHPNDAGYGVIANAVDSKLKTG